MQWILELPESIQGVLMGGLIGAAASILTAITTFAFDLYSSRRKLRDEHANEIAQITAEKKKDFQFKQLNELYGPLYFILNQLKDLQPAVKEGIDDEKELGDLPLVSDPVLWKAIHRNPIALEHMIELHRKATIIINTHIGLIRGREFNDVMHEFTLHSWYLCRKYELLKEGANSSSNMPNYEEYRFNNKFREHVESCYNELKEALMPAD